MISSAGRRIAMLDLELKHSATLIIRSRINGVGVNVSIGDSFFPVSGREISRLRSIRDDLFCSTARYVSAERFLPLVD